MFKYSIGNKKLGKDTLIFNMGPATTCPSRARGLCQVPAGKCYALKAERCYPACLPYREAQEMYWRTHSAGEIARDLIKVLDRKKAVKFVRVNESGDFRSLADVAKLFGLARLVPWVRFYVYTARRDFIQDLRTAPRNLVVNGSGFMVDNNFLYEAKEFDYKCPGDCRTCQHCKVKGQKTIRIAAH